MKTWFSLIIGMIWFASTANAQTLNDIGIPPTHIVISATTLGSTAQPIADTNQDGIIDYVVGIPWAADGQGAILVMPGPLPVAGRPAQDAIRIILGPYGQSLDLPTGFGASIEVGCDLNMDGMPEVWTVASYQNQFSEMQKSVLVFDLITNRVLWDAIDVPNLNDAWSGMMGCAPLYTHFIAPHVPFSFDDPGFWFEPYCEICSGGPGSTPTTTQDSSSTTTSRLSGNSSSVNSGIGGKVGEVTRWYTQTDMSLAQTAKAVAISAQASILGRAVAQSARDSGMDASQAEGISNAVRHAFWQMSLSRELGTDIAEQIGNIHEEGSDAPGTPLGLQRDSWVDQFNNERARQAYEQCIADGVCSDEELAAILAALLANGELITDKDCDSRIPATLRDCNGNGVPDGNECIPNPDQNNQVRADVNRDGIVNQSDALIVLDDLGTFNASTDQTGDCFVWVDDFDAVLDEMSE